MKKSWEKTQRNLINVHKYLKGGFKEDGAQLFSGEPSDRTRDNTHKLKCQRLLLNFSKCFEGDQALAQVTQRWSSLHPWRYPYAAWTWLSQAGRWTRWSSKVPSNLSYSVILWTCIPHKHEISAFSHLCNLLCLFKTHYITVIHQTELDYSVKISFIVINKMAFVDLYRSKYLSENNKSEIFTFSLKISAIYSFQY